MNSTQGDYPTVKEAATRLVHELPESASRQIDRLIARVEMTAPMPSRGTLSTNSPVLSFAKSTKEGIGSFMNLIRLK
jgi:hypothetical protein